MYIGDGKNSKWITFAATGIANLICAFSVNSMNLALPTLAELYGVDQGAVSWLALVYSLLPCCMLLFFGSLGDIFGYRRQFALGFALFGAVSFITPFFAKTLPMLIFFRCLQAVGYSMVVSLTQAIVSHSFPPEERGRALGVNTVFVSVGLAAGPTVGGLLLARFGWHSIFYFCLPFGILGAVMSLLVLPKDSEEKKDKTIDYGGALLFAGAAGCLAVALNFLDDWGFSLEFFGLLALSALSLTAFIFREKKAAMPLMPLSIFKNRTFSTANGASVLSYFVQQMVNYLAPFYLVSYLMMSSDKAGLVMLSLPMAMMLCAPVGGALSDKKGFAVPSVIGLGMISVTCILMGFLPQSNGEILTIIFLMLIGAGNGFSGSAINSAIFSGVTAEHTGVGSGMVATMRNLGQTLGVACASVLISIRNAVYVGGGASPEAAYLAAQRDTFLVGAFASAAAIVLILRLNAHNFSLAKEKMR